MNNYLKPDMSGKIREIPTQALAYVGDCVYELLVRTYLMQVKAGNANILHKETIKYVSATAQAKAAKIILPLLSDDETDIYKRGRNAHTRPAPKSSGSEEYHSATALETLFGYLYLCGNIDRINQLFETIINT